jgi:ketosteroid isomerase-like protein
MAHSNEETIRAAYASFARGDLDGYLGACTEDFTFNVPGSSRMSGRFEGRPGMLKLVENLMAITGGAFVEIVDDVLANDEHGIVLATHRLTRDGQQKEYHTAHVYNISHGKLAECWEQPQDQGVFEDAWGRFESGIA